VWFLQLCLCLRPTPVSAPAILRRVAPTVTPNHPPSSAAGRPPGDEIERHCAQKVHSEMQRRAERDAKGVDPRARRQPNADRSSEYRLALSIPIRVCTYVRGYSHMNAGLRVSFLNHRRSMILVYSGHVLVNHTLLRRSPPRPRPLPGPGARYVAPFIGTVETSGVRWLVWNDISM